MGMAVLLTFLNLAIEHSGFGHRLGWYATEEILRWSRSTSDSVVVVDVTDIPVTHRDVGPPVTSREALLALVKGLKSAGAVALGLDVDLSPEEEPLHPEDARFLESLLAVREEGHAGVPYPIFVGVHRGIGKGPAGWLGSLSFKELAAHLLVQRSRVPAAPTWVLPSDAEEPLWGLGPALVRARVGALPVDSGQGWFRSANVAEHPEPGAPISAFMLLDTSGLGQLVERRIRLSPGDTEPGACARFLESPAQADRVRGKIVLVGAADPDDERDNSFFVPGEVQPYPGVYMHACAVTTLLDGYLYEVTPLGRLAADLTLALFVFGGIALVHMAYLRLRRAPPAPLALFLVLLCTSVCLAGIGGLVGIARFRIVWDGFAYVWLAAALHLLLEAARHARSTARSRLPLAALAEAEGTLLPNEENP